MYLKQLKIDNYRNIKNTDLSFDPGCNILTGMNGQGKTNTIESICLTLTGKSHRESITENFIGPFKNSTKTEAEVLYDDGSAYHVSMEIDSEKKYRINDEPVKKRSELIRTFSVIFFSPEDLYLVKGSPAVRRSFINEAIIAVHPNYAGALSSYIKSVMQKNSLLKNYTPSCASLLEVYNESLVSYGSALIKYRIQFLKEFSTFLRKYYEEISDHKEQIKLTYLSNSFNATRSQDIPEAFAKVLDLNREKEIAARSCVVGPHHDDINLFLNEQNARKFASQGQQRSISLSMKLALIDLYYQKNSEKPIVILDDVMSELDSRRQGMIIQILDQIQTFITCVNADFLGSNRGALYEVQNGTIVQM